MDPNFGIISNLIFETFVWFLSKTEELGIHKISQWVQVQSNDGDNVISLLLRRMHILSKKVVFNNVC